MHEGLSIAEMRKAATGRFIALAAAQLSILATEGADLRPLITTLAAPLSPDPALSESQVPP